ncbi:Netrin receptor UNC5B-b [Holothuria leucospilota]|uniref:Netrin receptor UNC5 n=1 Tax=Holothuria leucospilota TaxID=206669 RepID=A0A9Q0YP81_HOLLE|nr:Netrin receptor UNC5B-b [Holothuria leucospilota]
MKRTLACLVSPKECEELRKYFGVTEEEMRKLEAGDEDKDLSDKEKTVRKMECLLTVIEERDHMNPYNVKKLTDAVSTLGDEICISDLEGPMEGYSLHSIVGNMQITMTEMKTRQKALEDERNQLSSKLERAENKVKQEHEKTLDDQQYQLVQTQEQEKMLREDLKIGELKIEELKGERMALTEQLQDSSKLIKTLTEELKQSKEESECQIEILTEELKQTKQSKTECERQIETLKEGLKRSKTESDRQIEAMTKELKQSKTESDRQIETLTEELKHSKAVAIVELTHMKREAHTKIEMLTEELEQTVQVLDLTKTDYANKIETLTAELNETKQKLLTRIKELETTSKDLELTKQTLKETAQDRDNTRIELKQYQLDFAKESKALKEVLKQEKEAMAELHKRPVEDKPLVDTEEMRDKGGAVLAAEFGRLTVAIAEHLRLDDCLKLAKICNIPASDCDTVLRVSMIESPGMKFLDVLKKRKVINMFDVTNLQKALAMLHLEAVNHDLVAPYQEKVDKEQYELYKVEEMYTWEDVDGFVNAAKYLSAQRHITDSQTSPMDDTEPEYSLQTEAAAQLTEAGNEGIGSFLGDRHHQLHAEHNIGREGGTIHLGNVSLTVPPDALRESHVIALSVMNESPFPLDREVDTARMTPLIKLEPLGLMFKKSLQLNIPHSALISEPENHDVIIYLGQIEDSSDSIRWTEERSIPRQLKAKSVTVDIQCLTYLSASLVSQTLLPLLHIVRAVPFLDGVRNNDDDIVLTICFCSDNDSEYNMLLSDYKTKLPLEQYSTLQLHRHSERDEDDAGFLSVTVTSVNNAYVPDREQAVKRVAVSHLCTASRVSHQLRLKNQDTDRDVVDILLTFSQAQYEPTQISLKARVKDLIISEESEKLLFDSVTPGNKMYKDMVVNISSSLDTEKCKKLATFFQLNPEDTEMITSNQDPGKMLMKTLKERSVIDTQKMIHFFEGLKACHLDETAKLVSEYISKISKLTQEEQQHDKDKNIEETQEDTIVSQYLLKKDQKTARSSTSDQSVQTTLSSSCVFSDVHVKTLTKEGYTEHEVVKALDISRNRLVMARKVLQCLEEQSDVSPTKDYIFLHKEQYIDENGGEITLREANVHLLIPVGAVTTGSVVSLTMMTSKQGNVPSEGRTPQLSPVIKVGPEGSTLNKDVILRIPHCASEMEGITSTDILLGFFRNGEEIQWRERKQHEPAPYLKKDHFEVRLQTFCAVSLKNAVDFKKPLGKKLRVLPLINRVENPTDDLILTLWIYNDDETEHMYLLHEEINVRGKMQLHDCKRFNLQGSEKDREVHIKSGSNKITSPADINMKKVLSTTLWHSTRHAVEFHFQNKEGISENRFRVRLCTKQVVWTAVDLQFDLNVKLSDLLQKSQGPSRALLTAQEPQPAMEKSFEELVSKLSGQLDMDSCLEIAGMFRLSSDLKDRVKKSSEPGKVIFEELIQEQLITAASVSALDVALTRCGKVVLAEDVRTYRHRNATFPTTIYTLL